MAYADDTTFYFKEEKSVMELMNNCYLFDIFWT